jgi:hypothetical protein
MAPTGNLVLWLRLLLETVQSMRIAANSAPAFRNADSDDRRLKSRFGNADRSSVSLPVETGSVSASFILAVPPPGVLRFSVDLFNRAGIFPKFCF